MIFKQHTSFFLNIIWSDMRKTLILCRVNYFEIKGLEKLGLDSIAILEFFEKLYSLFDARFEVTVTQGNSIVKCKSMSEGQRQLIKILGMLGICKTEDCLVLMDEPDAYMNPRWKYDIKSTMDQSLKDAINAQAIIATHDEVSCPCKKPFFAENPTRDMHSRFQNAKCLPAQFPFSRPTVFELTRQTSDLRLQRG